MFLGLLVSRFLRSHPRCESVPAQSRRFRRPLCEHLEDRRVLTPISYDMSYVIAVNSQVDIGNFTCTPNDYNSTCGFYDHTSPLHGSATFSEETDTLTYYPHWDFHGVDSFNYRRAECHWSAVCDIGNEATITVYVVRSPVANNDSYVVYRGQTLTVAAPVGLLANDEIDEGDEVTVSVED